MYAPQQAKFDPALSALLAVAKQVTPAGQPTVAAQVANAAQQQQAPQGIEAALTQSAQAAPSVAQNMQQQQMAQALQQAQQGQQPPQMMAEGGIATLPIEIGEYAEGGVIGYAGGGPAEYADPMGNLTGMSQPESEYVPTASERQAEEIRAAMRRMKIGQPRFDFQEGSDPRRLIQQLQAELADPSTSQQAKLAITSKIQELAAQIPPERPDSGASQEEVGIMSQREAPSIAPQIERPTAAAARGIAAGIVPTQDQTEGQRLYEAFKAAQQNRPDFDAQKAQALEDAHAKEKSGRGWESVIRYGNATARGGLGGIGVEALQFKKEKEALDSARDQGRIAAQEAAEARKIGDIKGLMEANQKLSDAKQKYDELTAQAGTSAFTSLGSQYATDVNAQERGRERVSAERIANLGGSEAAMYRLAQEDPVAFANYASLKATGKPGGTRAAQMDKYRDDYNRLVIDMMGRQSLEDEGIKTFADYVRVNDAYLAGTKPVAAAPEVGTVLKGYRFKGGNPADQANWEKV